MPMDSKGRFEGYLIVTDMDGTLCHGNMVISQENLRAIQYFQENGGLFTVATGRSWSHLAQFEHFKPNAGCILLNGSMVADHLSGKVLYEKTLCKEDLKVAGEVWKYSAAIEEITLFYKDEGAVKTISYIKEYNRTFEEYFQNFTQDIYKIIFFFATEKETMRVRDWTKTTLSKEYFFDRSFKFGLEMTRSSKGMAVDILKKQYEGIVQTVICIGDFDNDISMLKTADIAIAAKNATDEVKQCANMITVSNKEHIMEKVIGSLSPIVAK